MDPTIETGTGAGIIILIMQGLKAFKIPTKIIPLLNLALGIIWGVITVQGPVEQKVIQGVITGAAAGGVYDTVHKGSTE